MCTLLPLHTLSSSEPHVKLLMLLLVGMFPYPVLGIGPWYSCAIEGKSWVWEVKLCAESCQQVHKQPSQRCEDLGY